MNILLEGFIPYNEKEPPVIPKGNFFTVDVWFITNGCLYHGYYHSNGCFYSYYHCNNGNNSIIANSDGKSKTGTSQFSICTHWKYLDNHKIKMID